MNSPERATGSASIADIDGPDAPLIACLVGGMTNRKAATQLGIDESVIYRRLRDPDFRTQLAQARSAIVAGVVGQLSHASVKAVDTLQALLKSKSDVAKLGAARAILEHATKLRESEETASRP